MPLTAGPGPLVLSEMREAPWDQGGHVPVQTSPNWKEGGPSAGPSLGHPDPLAQGAWDQTVCAEPPNR